MSILNKKQDDEELHLIAPSKDKKQLSRFYTEWLQLLSETISPQHRVCIHGTKRNLIPLRTVTTDERFTFKEILSNKIDCWIRDFAPIQQNHKMCKFYFHPQYYNYQSNESEWVSDMNLFGQHFIDLPKSESTLILDGGNFVSDGNTAILTKRVLEDNPSWDIVEIKEELKAHLGIQSLLIIPCEPGDETGHTDGVVRFIETNKVIVADYPSKYKLSAYSISYQEYLQSKEYVDRVCSLLQDHLEIVRLTSLIPDKRTRERIASAYGNYTNFLIFGDILYLPKYNNREQDANAHRIIAYHFQNKKIIPVDCTALAIYGGVLNCISWVR